jgi:hypothetical protein
VKNPGPFTIHANTLFEIPLIIKTKRATSQVIANIVGKNST